MKFYNLKPGMNPRRARIFMAEKGIEVPMVEVDMSAIGAYPTYYKPPPYADKD